MSKYVIYGKIYSQKSFSGKDMEKFNKVISEKRRPIETPNSLIKDDGTALFGTFDKEFVEMDLTKLDRPTMAPNIFNRFKLTLWEACEVNLKDGILLAACSDMALFGKIFILFYDKKSRKIYTWDTNTRSKKAVIADNLINSSETKCYTKKGHVHFVNNLDKGLASISGKHINANKDTIEFEFNMTRLSNPSIVSIPFGENRPLYSQKDFLKATGKIVVNGVEYLSDDTTTALMDDHKGYYPRKAHYDWLATMGKCEINGKMEYLGFNLTDNQSINPSDYNENILWFHDKYSLLPPVKFEKSTDLHNYDGYSEWIVKDEYDMVNLKYKIYAVNTMVINLKIAKIDYFVNFGEIEGYLRDEEGNKYVVDGMVGISEDKTLLL